MLNCDFLSPALTAVNIPTTGRRLTPLPSVHARLIPQYEQAIGHRPRSNRGLSTRCGSALNRGNKHPASGRRRMAYMGFAAKNVWGTAPHACDSCRGRRVRVHTEVWSLRKNVCSLRLQPEYLTLRTKMWRADRVADNNWLSGE